MIKLLGYCNNKDKRKCFGFFRKEAKIYFSVFEYMTNGSLFDHLFSDKRAFELSWAQRIKIANGCARALDYLHECGIIHRDVKSANILLDSDFNSKLADFGSTTDLLTATSSIRRDGICGTPCYIPPECIFDGIVSKKIDVYAFGVTLLEILSGRHAAHLSMKVQKVMPLEINNDVEVKLLPWKKFIIFTTFDLTKFDNLMDSRLNEKCPLEVARLAVQLALRCVEDDPLKRPSMKEIVKVLEGIQTIIMPSAVGQIISDLGDPLSCDINLVSRSMVYESAPFHSSNLRPHPIVV